MHVRSLSEYNPDIPLVRPLLGIWREEILDYCQNHHLEFRLDESNQLMDHTRSKLRNRLIPELAQYNPNIKGTLFRTQQVLAEDFSFLQEAIASAAKDIGLTIRLNTVELEIKEFRKLPVSMQRLVIKDILEKYFFDQNIISFSNIEYVRRLFTREMKKSTLEISNQLFMFIFEGKGILTRKRNGELVSGWPRIEKELILNVQAGKYPINEKWQLEIEETHKDQVSKDIFKNQDPYTAFFDAKKINEKITIRSWNKGDSFKPLGMKGKSIKLSDFWINRKISPFARSTWPLVMNKDSIIWIPGLQQDHNTRIVNKTQNIIIMRLKSKP
jgi:tRNA(Ile)-lysidine synthase